MDHSENAPLPPKPGPATPAVPTPAVPTQAVPTPTDRAESSADSAGTPAEETRATTPPETGDIVVDATLRDLAAVDDTDLQGTLAAGESVHATLTARLSDLGT